MALLLTGGAEEAGALALLDAAMGGCWLRRYGVREAVITSPLRGAVSPCVYTWYTIVT